MNIFEKFSKIINDGEDSVINLLCVVAPWLVPVIPAFLTYWHTVNDLGFPEGIAWTSAIVVEVLGLASMRTSISFFEHNKRYVKGTNKAPFAVTISTYFFYLLIILTVNILLDVTNGVKWVNVIAIGLFSLLSVPAGVLISVRTQHSELIKELNERRFRTNEHRTSTERTARKRTNRRTNERTPNGDIRQKIGLFVRSKQKNEQRTPGPTEIATVLGVSKGYASDVLAKLSLQAA